MEKFRFLKTTPVYKELTILSEIARDSETTQKKLADLCEIAPSMVNKYISSLEDRGYISIDGTTTRNTSYHLTDSGKNRIMVLTISYNRDIARMYKSSQKTFQNVWNSLAADGIRRVLLFGAGDIGEMAVEVVAGHGIDVAGFLDENPSRIGGVLHGVPILAPDRMAGLDYDAVIITSYRHSSQMTERVRVRTDRPIYVFTLENGVVTLQTVDS